MGIHAYPLWGPHPMRWSSIYVTKTNLLSKILLLHHTQIGLYKVCRLVSEYLNMFITHSAQHMNTFTPCAKIIDNFSQGCHFFWLQVHKNKNKCQLPQNRFLLIICAIFFCLLLLNLYIYFEDNYMILCVFF